MFWALLLWVRIVHAEDSFSENMLSYRIIGKGVGCERLWRKNKIERAFECWEQLLSLTQKKGLDVHPVGAYVNRIIGWHYYEDQQLEPALEHLQQSLQIHQHLNGVQTPDVAELLYLLGLTYSARLNHQEALEHHLASLQLYFHLYGEQAAEIVHGLYAVGKSYVDLNDHQKALPYYQKAVQLSHQGDFPLGKTVEILSGLGGVYASLDDVDNAIEVYEKSLLFYRTTYGEQHAEVVVHTDVLGLLYYRRGDYKRALQYHEQSITLWSDTYGENHPRVAANVKMIGLIYSALGDHERALYYHQKCLKLYHSMYGNEHPDVARALNELGSTYYDLGVYQKALDAYIQSLRINEKVLGGQHIQVATNLNNIGAVYDDLQQYTTAMEYYERSLAIHQKQNPNGAGVPVSLSNIGGVHHRMGKYDTAISYYERSLREFQENKRVSFYVVDVLNNLGSVYSAMREYDKALVLFSRAEDMEEQLLQQYLHIGSISEKQLYLDTLSLSTSTYLSLASVSSQEDTIQFAANIIFKRKARSISESQQEMIYLRRNMDRETQLMFDDLQGLQKEYASFFLQPPEELSIEDIELQQRKLSSKISQLEAELRQKSERYTQREQRVEVSTIAKKIEADELLMEWVVYDHYDFDNSDLIPRLALMTLDAQQNINWYDLGAWNEVESLIVDFRKSIANKSSNVVVQGQMLWERLLSPAEKELSIYESLILVPDATLHLLPFSALTTSTNKWFIEEHTIRYISSGRELLNDHSIQSKSPPLVIANPNFDFQEQGEQKIRKSKSFVNHLSRDFTKQHFSPLLGAEAEARDITKKLSLSDKQVWLQDQASENLLRTVPSPYLLHIATHGFFLSNQVVNSDRSASFMGQEEQQSFIENPMLRSGLAFRGANHPFNEGEDGLLTAFEIANIDLFGTELVVLSACETGVGETKIGEGVTGLKRALFLAGSKTQVLSLWKVDDFATRTLMTEWYSALLNGDDRVESLQDVQLRMATNQLSEENASQADEDRSSSLSLPHETETGDDNFSGWSHPYYWAAFTISGNDGPVSLEQ